MEVAMKTMMMAMAALVVASSAVAQDAGDPRKQEAVSRLSNLKVSVDFSDITLRQAVEYLRDVSGLNFHIDSKCDEKADKRVTLKVKDLSLKTVIKFLLTPEELTAVWRDGVMVVMPKSAVAAATTIQVYDIRDLMLAIEDFAGPMIELKPAGQGPGIIPIFPTDPPKPPMTEDVLLDLIKGSTGGKSWDEPACSITCANGLLVVSQSKSVHAELAAFLNKIRQFK
jgi:hypothetical protein